MGALEFFLISIDSILSDPNFSFVDFFYSFEDWYSVYRFAENVNQEYTLLSIDTTITSITTFPLRFEYLGERLNDETINTEIGTFICKKFVITWKVSALFGPVPVKLLSTENTFWIAEDNWVVQDIVPTNHVDLSFLSIDPFSIPGLKTEIISNIVSVNETPNIPNTITLYQNYPNPFNPSTTIKYQIHNAGLVTLKVYDMLGNEVATLVEEEKPTGIYEVEFRTSDLSSGIYFYKLQSGNFVESKKMLILK